MVQEGKVEVSNFKFINRISDDFPLLHSTQLYPEYPMAVCQHVPSDVRSLVSKLLLSLPPSDPAVTSAKIAGWKEPLEYKPVVECLTSIKYGAFEESASTSGEDKKDNSVQSSGSGQAKTPVQTAKGRAVP
jgi:ABC-type phosphate/phosphonate transport system substrate-binding protein